VPQSIPLRKLEAELLWQIAPDFKSFRTDAPDVAHAQGIKFLCPVCFTKNGGPVGTHLVICWFSGVPQKIDPRPGRWNPEGTSIDDITFVGPGAASVKLTGGCNWHGFIKNGCATL